MLLFLDCEFNGFGGELISMALVSGRGHEWYEVLLCENPVPWVSQNVIPILGKTAVPFFKMQESLEKWLFQFDDIYVIADWPEDIAYFCNTLITGPGYRLYTPPMKMEILMIDYHSKLPHNALFDARGIKDSYYKRYIDDIYST